MYKLATRHALHERARRRSRRHLIQFLTTLVLVFLWWITLAPQSIGGPLTYAVVSGSSMEPDFFDGDLIVAQTQSGYAVGDSVVYSIYGGYVVHQIIAESESGFKTQGVNNPTPDSWTVPPKNILGKQLVAFPGFGNTLVFLRTHPLALGALVALLAALLLVEIKPRRLSSRLESLVAQGVLELPPKKWTGGSWLVSTLFILATASLVATSIMLTNGVDFFPRVALTLAAAVVATIGFEVMAIWLASGNGFAEPYKSIRRFGKQLYLVDEAIDIPGDSQLLESSDQLHKLADAANSPILHIVRNGGRTHEFWLVTDDLNFFWRVSV